MVFVVKYDGDKSMEVTTEKIPALKKKSFLLQKLSVAGDYKTATLQ